MKSYCIQIRNTCRSMTRRRVLKTMNDTAPKTTYVLPTESGGTDRGTLLRAGKSLLPLLSDEKWNLLIALGAILVNSLSTLLGPIIIANAVDKYIITGNFKGVLIDAGML